MTGLRVLVADDDQAVRASLERVLRHQGYQVDVARDGAEALAHAMTHLPDAVILDVLMPVIDGLQACRTLRLAGHTMPILLLTAGDGMRDRADGRDAGADDYVVKPFALPEVPARLRALLRRGARPADRPRGTLRYADVTLDRETREVSRGAQRIELTPTEFTLLDVFMSHPGQVLTRRRLFEAVWGYEPRRSNTVDVYVGYLRRKLEAGGGSRLLHTRRGVGFVLQHGADDGPA